MLLCHDHNMQNTYNAYLKEQIGQDDILLTGISAISHHLDLQIINTNILTNNNSCQSKKPTLHLIMDRTFTSSFKFTWYIAALWWVTPQSSVKRKTKRGKGQNLSVADTIHIISMYVCMYVIVSIYGERKFENFCCKIKWELRSQKSDAFTGRRQNSLLLHIHQTYLS